MRPGASVVWTEGGLLPSSDRIMTAVAFQTFVRSVAINASKSFGPPLHLEDLDVPTGQTERGEGSPRGIPIPPPSLTI